MAVCPTQIQILRIRFKNHAYFQFPVHFKGINDMDGLLP